MRVLTYVAPGTVEWREAPDPALQGRGEALVRPVVVATCDLDGHLVRGEVPFPGPFPIGHECVAEVLDVGDAVTSVAPGDLVVVAFQVSCGACRMCRSGRTASCTSVPTTSMYGVGDVGGGWGGAFADVLRVPYADHMLVRVPAGVSPHALASASDNVADGWRAALPAARDPEAEVLVLAGTAPTSIALYATEAARALGVTRVHFAGVDSRTVDAARLIGAEAEVVDHWPRKFGSYAVTVDASNDPAGLACAIRSTEPGGTCTGVGMYFGDVAVPMFDMYMKGITFETGRVHACRWLPEIVDLVASGRLSPERVTSETAEWDDAADAILAYTNKLVVYRDE
jgi:alcohol dehydrogenase